MEKVLQEEGGLSCASASELHKRRMWTGPQKGWGEAILDQMTKWYVPREVTGRTERGQSREELKK